MSEVTTAERPHQAQTEFKSGDGKDTADAIEKSFRDKLSAESKRPVNKIKLPFQESLKRTDGLNTFVIAGTANGKTVDLPRFALEIMGDDEKIAITVPTQVNASGPAGFVSSEMGVTLGEEVGYQHGGEKKSTKDTRILYTTEGSLLQKIIRDPYLTEFNCVMADEIHTRGKSLELLLALLKKAQAARKEKGMPDLKIIAASATVDKEEMAKYFSTTPIESEGKRMHEIKTEYTDYEIRADQQNTEAAKKVAEWLKEGVKGDYGYAVKSNNELGKVRDELRKLGIGPDDMQVIGIHSKSTQAEKDQVARAAENGKPRLFVCTDAVQTGVTFHNLTRLINSGRKYEQAIDPISGLERLREVNQTQAEIGQWTGRLGRTAPPEGNGPDVCYNLFTQSDFESREKYPTPEIQRTDLADVLLTAKRTGIDLSKDLLSSPLNEDNIAAAQATLMALGALDKQGELTEIGKRMSELPCDYNYARMIAEAERVGRGVEDACTIAALAENSLGLAERVERGVEKPLEKFAHAGSDFITYLNAWREFVKAGKSEAWAKENKLNFVNLMKVDMEREKLLERINTKNETATDEELQKLIIIGFANKIMEYHPVTRSYSWNRNQVDNINIKIDRSSVLYGVNPEYIISGSTNPVEEGKRDVYVSLCQTINPEWISGSPQTAA